MFEEYNMKCPFKKGISDNNSFLKKSRKLASVIVVFLLLSTLFSTVVSSEGISSLLNKEPEKSLLQKFFEGKSIKERFQETKDRIHAKISEIKNRLVEIENDESTETRTLTRLTTETSLLATLRTIIAIKNSDSPLVFHTNYNGNSKSTEMGLFGKVTVDLDDNGDDDISARMLVYPFIERPFCLSIRFKLTITRLESFPDINEDFSAYVELTFLGLLSEKQKGDTLGFGYVSPENEEVPDQCVVTYKYIPHILSTERPEHKAEIDPGTIAGEDDLVLFFQYTNYDGTDVASQLISTTVYSPAVQSEVHIWGTGLLGGPEYNFERTGSDDSDINMYCSFTKNNTNIYGYVYDLPQKVTFNLDLGIDGYIDFDTHGEAVSEIGLNAELYDNENKIYFKDLPSKARLEWNHDIIFDGKANFSFYTEGKGISLNVHLEPQKGGIFDLSVLSNENLDCSAELDFNEGYLIIDKTDVDLSLSLKATGVNNSIIQLSFNISKEYVNPFEFYFNLSDKFEVTFANNSLILTDLNLLVDMPGLNFGIIADKLVKNQSGNISVILDHNMVDENVSLNFTFLLEHGLTVEIYGLEIGYNGNWTKIEPDPLILTTSWSFKFNILLSAFEYYVAEDWSWGYFCFKGEISYETYHPFSVMGVDGAVMGTIFAGSTTDGFNISWYTDTSEGYNLTKLNITGMTIGLRDFHFYIGDLINLSISSITGTIIVNEACNESGSVKFESIGNQTNLDINFGFNFSNVQEPKGEGKNETGVRFSTLMEDFHVDLAETSFSFEFNWADDNTSNIIILADSNINLTIGRFDLSLIVDRNITLNVANMTGYIQGKSGIDVNLSLPLNLLLTENLTYLDLSEDTFAITLTDVDIYLSIDNLNLGFMEQLMNISMDLGNIEISASATGFTSISLINISLEKETRYVTNGTDFINITWINIDLGIYAVNSNLDLYRLEIGNIQGIVNILLQFMFGWPPISPEIQFILENTSITGGSNISLQIGIVFGAYPLIGLKFENDEGTYLSVEKISGVLYTLLDYIPDYIKQNLSEELLTNLTENPFTIFAKDLELVEGVLDMMITPIIPSWMGLEIVDGSAIKNADIIAVEFPGLAEIIILSIEEPVRYLNIQFDNWGINNNTAPFDRYLLIDTDNFAVSFDLFKIDIDAEFANLLIDLTNDLLNTSISHFEHDQGIWIDENILIADDFYFYLNTSAVPNPQGYLHIEIGGNIYLKRNGSWEIIVYGEAFSLTVYPGHVQIRFNFPIISFKVDREIQIDGQRKLIIIGEFTCPTVNGVIDYWYNESENYLAIEKIEAVVGGSIEINNYSFSILKNDTYGNFTLEGESLSISGQDIITGYVAYYNNTSFAVGASLGATIGLTNSKLTIQSGYYADLDGAINASILIPDFHGTFGAGVGGITSEFIILLLALRPFKIDGNTNVTLEIGEKHQFKAKNPPGGQELVEWVSSDPTKVYINRTSGLAIGLNVTNPDKPVTIYCFSAGIEAENRAKVTVVLEKDFYIDQKDNIYTIFINQSVQLTPHYHEDPVTWKSSDPEIATVDSDDGLVTGISEGEVTIIAEDADGKVATLNITVISYPTETKLYIEGSASISGICQLGLYYSLERDAFYYTILAKGNLTFENVHATLIRPKNEVFLELAIPNRLEIENGTIDLVKSNNTSPAVFRWGGVLNLYPGKSDFGYVGLGIRRTAEDKIIGDLILTVESLFLSASVADSSNPGGGGITPSVPLSRNSGTIDFEFDPNSDSIGVSTDSDSISLSLKNLNVSISRQKIIENEETAFVFTLEALRFNKMGKIRWIFNNGKFKNQSGSNIENNSKDFYVRLEHSANYQSTLDLENLTLIRFKNAEKKWEFPIIKRLNVSKFKQGYNVILIEILDGEYINFTHNQDMSCNASIYIGWFFDQRFQGLWEFNSTISVNSTFHIIPGFELFGEQKPAIIEWTIYEPGNFYHFKLTHKGAFGLHQSFEIGPIQLTPGKIVFEIMRGDQGFFCMDNQGVTGGGELIKYTGNLITVTLGWFEINYGTLNLSWDKIAGDIFSWYNLTNIGMYSNFGLLKVETGNLEIIFGEVTLRPGYTYYERQKFSNSGYHYIENTANIDLDLFSIKFGIGEKFSIGFESGLQMKPGRFRFTWEESTHPDFDTKYILRNSVFECSALAFVIGFADDENETELKFDLWDLENTDYNNIITVQLHDGSGAIPTGIYIDTSDYIELQRWSIALYRNGWKQFEINSSINLKFKFEGFYIGIFDDGFKKGGKIRPGIGITGTFEFLISLIFKGDNGVMQELGIDGAFDLDLNTYPNTASYSIDLTDCSQDIELSSGALSIGDKYSITGTASFNANSYFTADLYSNLNTAGDHFSTTLSIDNGGTPVIGDLTLTLLNDITDNGFGLTVSGLQADDFWVSCAFEKGPLGAWWPDWDNIGTGGSLVYDGFVLSICVNGNWFDVPIGDIILVEIQGTETVLMQEAQAVEVEYTVVVYGGTAPYTYIWTLPNGLTATGRTTNYTFDTLGLFVFDVEVIDAAGLIGVSSKVVEVVNTLYGTLAL